MDNNRNSMDDHKMLVPLEPRDLEPTVRIANYIQAPVNAAWLERTIPDYELIYIVAGGLSYSDPTGSTTGVAGQILTLCPGVRHTLRVDARQGPATISCLHGELVPNASALTRDYVLAQAPKLVTSDVDRGLMHDLFRRCAEAFEGHGTIRHELCRTIAREIWLRLIESWSRAEHTELSLRVAAMVSYLREHLTSQVGRQELAARFHMTPEHVNYLFKKELGTTPTQLVQRERVLLAYRLLREESLSVKEAAARVGYEDPFYFSRLFTRIAGINPSRV